jgi:hypothetical protein
MADSSPTEAEAQTSAASFTAPASALAASEFAPDILATGPAARTGLLASHRSGPRTYDRLG